MYTNALNEMPTDHTIFGNRSASYLKIKFYDKALQDADKCIELKPDWFEGYQRKGNILHVMGKHVEALIAY